MAVDHYAEMIKLIHRLLEGDLEATKFEDECRVVLGCHSYPLFTIDKLLSNVVKQVR